MSSLKSYYHDKDGNPLKLVNVLEGKTWHQAYLLEGEPNTPMCEVRWCSNDKKEQVLTRNVDFNSHSGRRSRRATQRYIPTSPKEPLKTPTKKAKIEAPQALPVAVSKPTRSTSAEKVSRVAKSKDDIIEIEESDEDDSTVEMADSTPQCTEKETPSTEKRYVAGVDDESSSSESEAESKEDITEEKEEETPHEKEEPKAAIKPVRVGLRERKRKSYQDEQFPSSVEYALPVLNVMIPPGNTIDNDLVKKAEEELMPYLNKHRVNIILSKSDEFIETIVMEPCVKSCELLLVAMRKLNQSNTKVIQKLFDFYEPLRAPLRRIFLSWFPYVMTQMKNKRFNVKMKMETKKYQYAEKVEESLACEILTLIRTIDFGAYTLFTKTRDSLEIDFVSLVNEAKELANTHIIRPVLETSTFIKDYINSLKLGKEPPAPPKKKKRSKSSVSLAVDETIALENDNKNTASNGNSTGLDATSAAVTPSSRKKDTPEPVLEIDITQSVVVDLEKAGENKSIFDVEEESTDKKIFDVEEANNGESEEETSSYDFLV